MSFKDFLNIKIDAKGERDDNNGSSYQDYLNLYRVQGQQAQTEYNHILRSLFFVYLADVAFDDDGNFQDAALRGALNEPECPLSKQVKQKILAGENAQASTFYGHLKNIREHIVDPGHTLRFLLHDIGKTPTGVEFAGQKNMDVSQDKHDAIGDAYLAASHPELPALPSDPKELKAYQGAHDMLDILGHTPDVAIQPPFLKDMMKVALEVVENKDVADDKKAIVFYSRFLHQKAQKFFAKNDARLDDFAFLKKNENDFASLTYKQIKLVNFIEVASMFRIDQITDAAEKASAVNALWEHYDQTYLDQNIQALINLKTDNLSQSGQDIWIFNPAHLLMEKLNKEQKVSVADLAKMFDRIAKFMMQEVQHSRKAANYSDQFAKFNVLQCFESTFSLTQAVINLAKDPNTKHKNLLCDAKVDFSLTKATHRLNANEERALERQRDFIATFSEDKAVLDVYESILSHLNKLSEFASEYSQNKPAARQDLEKLRIKIYAAHSDLDKLSKCSEELKVLELNHRLYDPKDEEALENCHQDAMDRAELIEEARMLKQSILAKQSYESLSEYFEEVLNFANEQGKSTVQLGKLQTEMLSCHGDLAKLLAASNKLTQIELSQNLYQAGDRDRNGNTIITAGFTRAAEIEAARLEKIANAEEAAAAKVPAPGSDNQHNDQMKIKWSPYRTARQKLEQLKEALGQGFSMKSFATLILSLATPRSFNLFGTVKSYEDVKDQVAAVKETLTLEEKQEFHYQMLIQKAEKELERIEAINAEDPKVANLRGAIDKFEQNKNDETLKGLKVVLAERRATSWRSPIAAKLSFFCPTTAESNCRSAIKDVEAVLSKATK